MPESAKRRGYGYVAAQRNILCGGVGVTRVGWRGPAASRNPTALISAARRLENGHSFLIDFGEERAPRASPQESREGQRGVPKSVPKRGPTTIIRHPTPTKIPI